MREHEALTSPSQVRQFTCVECDHSWWRVVLARKAVSRRNHCNRRYDVLPRDQEYGLSRFTCSKCGYTIFRVCHSISPCQCPHYQTNVSGQYEHSNSSFRVIHVRSYSTPHVSTVSTVDTELSKTVLSQYKSSNLTLSANYTYHRRTSSHSSNASWHGYSHSSC